MTPSPRLLWTAFAAVVCIIALIAVVSFLSDLFGFKARKIERLQREAETAQSDAYARSLESEGQAEQITRIESAGRLTIDVNTITAEAVAEARNATDANEPLPSDRASRLAAHDRSLCDLRPLPGCPAPSDASPAGE